MSDEGYCALCGTTPSDMRRAESAERRAQRAEVVVEAVRRQLAIVERDHYRTHGSTAVVANLANALAAYDGREEQDR